MNVVITTLFKVTLLVLSVKFMQIIFIYYCEVFPPHPLAFPLSEKTHGNEQLSYASNKFPAQVTHHV